jgi:ribonuclease P protein component
VEGVAANTSFPKKERLCGRTAISQLLGKGRYGTVPGMSYLYIKDTGNDHARLLISVPKKTFKRAVKRNLYKRRIRESWRRQKHLLT